MKNAMSAKKSVCGMSCGAMHEFALTLDKAGFDADLVKKIISSRGNRLAKDMRTALEVDSRFKLIDTFKIIVPEDYDHSTCLETFRAEHREDFESKYNRGLYCYDENLTDKNFSKTTTKLAPGEELEVKVFKTEETVTSCECLTHILSQKNPVLVGAQGLTIAYKQGKDLPVDIGIISLDKKEALWHSPVGLKMFPKLQKNWSGGNTLSLDHFDHHLFNNVIILCFCDVNE